MAELETEIEMAQYMLYKAATDKQEGRSYSVPAAKAKMVCTDAAMHVATEAVQMLGGNGYMKEYHVERMLRDAKITQIYEKEQMKFRNLSSAEICFVNKNK